MSMELQLSEQQDAARLDGGDGEEESISADGEPGHLTGWRLQVISFMCVFRLRQRTGLNSIADYVYVYFFLHWIVLSLAHRSSLSQTIWMASTKVAG